MFAGMGDLKSLGHTSSYSLDRRGVGPPSVAKNYYEACQEKNNNVNSSNSNKFNSFTKIQNNKNLHMNKSVTHIIHTNPHTSPGSINKGSVVQPGFTSGPDSLSNGHSPPSYPLPPPRPPSLQSNSSMGANLEHNSQRIVVDNKNISYDPMPPSYDHHLSNPPPSRPASGYDPIKFSNDLPRFESLRNLSSTEQHNGIIPTRHHHRMGGSVSNLARLGHHSGSNLGLDRSMSVTGSNLGLDRSVSGSNLGLDRGGSGSVRGSLSELRLDDHQTPSPSDSGVAELEAMLKEKDSEINNLKETMDKNEQVIFKVRII